MGSIKKEEQMKEKKTDKRNRANESGVTRREFLKKSAVVAGGTMVGTGIFGNGPYVFTPAYAATQIRTIGIPVSIIPDIQKKATKDLKMKVIGQAMSSEAMVQKQRTQPGERLEVLRDGKRDHGPALAERHIRYRKLVLLF